MSDVIEWLLESDPAIRWQVMADLTDESPEVVAEERSQVAASGWGATLLAQQAEDGQWGVGDIQHLRNVDELPDAVGRKRLREIHRVADEEIAGYLGVDLATLERWETDPLDTSDDSNRPYLGFMRWAQASLGTYNPKWTSTTYTLLLMRHLGIDPESAPVREALDRVEENVKWVGAGDPAPSFFDGETETCVNGMVVTIGAYFDRDTEALVDRLLSERQADGGWNCEIENGSVRSSFHTTLTVLEAFAEYEKSHGPRAELTEARRTGEEYLLDRKLMRRLSTGEIVDPVWSMFSFPPGWHYDVLRCLDYMRSVRAPDDRCAEAIELVASKRGDDGRWVLENTHPGDTYFDLDPGDGQPSRWNTLRAMRVLEWFSA